MRKIAVVAAFMELCLLMPINGAEPSKQEPGTLKLSSISGTVFRSDTHATIANAFIQFMQDVTSPAVGDHFDTRTDEHGKYHFSTIPAGKYTVSIYAWFPERNDVPCSMSSEAKTANNGRVKVEWQWKSRAFMEIVVIEGFLLEEGQTSARNFDLVCK